MRGVSTLRAKGTCVRPVALATMNTIERRIIRVSFDEASTPAVTRSSKNGTQSSQIVSFVAVPPCSPHPGRRNPLRERRIGHGIGKFIFPKAMASQEGEE